MPAGVDEFGFTKKTIEDIKLGIEEDLLSNLDPTLVQEASQPIGMLNAAFSKVAAELWQIAEVAYHGFNRAAADGVQLDNVGALTGTPREAARKTLVECSLDLNASFSQAPGALMAHVDGQELLQFVNRDAVVSTGAGVYTAWFEATVEGPIHVNAATLTQITNAVSGWNSITNSEDGVAGALVEENDDYRIRQEDELFASGSSTSDAIRVDVLQVDGVQKAFCYENVTMLENADGMPAHSIEVVIYDGLTPGADDDEIAQAIWDSKPSGVENVGTSSGEAIDSLERVRVVKFTRATVKDVYLTFDVVVDPQRFPADGVAQIKEAAVLQANRRSLDDDVIALAIRASPVEVNTTDGVQGVRGVTDVPILRLGFTTIPTGLVNLHISGREIANFDTSRVVVNLI